MIRTTYFARVKKLGLTGNLVSIARVTVPGFPGRSMMKLAPSSRTLWNYKQTGDDAQYLKEFWEDLNKLDFEQVRKELGEDAIMVCYEGEGKFCHRHEVAKWLRQNGEEVEEI